MTGPGWTPPPGQPKKPATFAIIALVLGIIAFLTGLVPILGLLLGAGAVALGIVALVKKQSKGMAITALVLGGLAFISSASTTAALGSIASNVGSERAPVVAESSEAIEPAAEEAPVAEPEVVEEAPEPEPEPEPVEPALYGKPYPADQQAFIDIIDQSVADLDAATTELQTSQIVVERDANLCAALTSNGMQNWVGKILEIGANGDGYAHVRIEIAPNVVVQTWNNAFSDFEDDTLIKPSQPFFDKLVGMEEDALVTFSGTLLSSSDSCLKGSNLTDTFYGYDPNFITRFADISAQ